MRGYKIGLCREVEVFFMNPSPYEWQTTIQEECMRDVPDPGCHTLDPGP